MLERPLAYAAPDGVPLPAHVPAHRASERGLTMIELLVVAAIVIVIATFAVGSVRNSRSNGDMTQARSLARALGEGIEQFQRDHGGRLPGDPGTADWTPPGGTAGQAWLSPVDAGNGSQPYVKRGVLGPLDDGVVTLQTAAGGIAPNGAGARTRITYRADVANGVFALVLSHDRNGDGFRARCYIASSDVSAAMRGGLRPEEKC